MNWFKEINFSWKWWILIFKNYLKEIIYHIKMENHTVVQFIALAKQLGMKGYQELERLRWNRDTEAHPVVNEQVLPARVRVDMHKLNIDKLKVHALMHDIKCYYKLNKAALIKTLKISWDVNEPVLPARIREFRNTKDW